MSAITAAVVVPTYNRPEQLRRCLAAIAAGERKPEEIWIVDQTRDAAAKQDNEQVCLDFGARYLYLETANASQARNAGMQAAHSDLIAYTDDDCLADPRWLAALVEDYGHASQTEEVSAVTGRVLPLLSGKNRVAISSRVSTERRLFRADRGGMERGEWAPWDAGNGPNIMSPRRTLQAIGGFSADLGPGTPNRAAEDIDLLYRLARAGTIVYQPGAVVRHMGRTRASRIRSRFGYGLGMGAMFRRQMAANDRAARSLLRLYVRHQLAGITRHGIWGPPEAGLVLAGLVRGLLNPAPEGSPSRSNKEAIGLSSLEGTGKESE